ncbi:MAG: LacI family DNA-binding transcriptional regulator [Verrucomicrobia bacterium]|nr:LacI family DNA-binding transcriptional regulator [Verrucomicrobiota bacterium]
MSCCSRWLAEGRYRSMAELARAAGVSWETVSRVLRRASLECGPGRVLQ